MKKVFENKVVIITGGSSGIRRTTAIALAKRGAKVVIADWIEDKETLDFITLSGGNAIFIKCDLSKKSDIKMLFEKTVNTFGGLDFAFRIDSAAAISVNSHILNNEISKNKSDFTLYEYR